MSRSAAAIILAAGQGKRMSGALPKVLHPIAGLPVLAHVVRTASTQFDPVVVVVGPESQPIRDALCASGLGNEIQYAVQERPLGTAHATAAGLEALGGFRGQIAILCGDVPLLRPETLRALKRGLAKAPLALVTSVVADPTGYGRIIRKPWREGRTVRRIVEERDCTSTERALREINAGIYVAERALLDRVLPGVTNENTQREFYLTDVVAQAPSVVAILAKEEEVRGINTQDELDLARRYLHQRLVASMRARGVLFDDVDRVTLDVRVRASAGARIGVDVQLIGDVWLSRGAYVQGPSVLIDTHVGRDAVIAAFSHLEGAKVGVGCRIGPFARLRPGSIVGKGAHVGNFVETKNTTLGPGAKANHLAYLGDCKVGARSNIGAGTITCNYDGVHKHPTIIDEDVFVGSNSTLVAPVEIGHGAYIAAGSVITHGVEAGALAFGRARQTNRAGYAKSLRARQKVKVK